MEVKDGAVILALIRGAVAIGHRDVLPARVDADEINEAPKHNEIGMHCGVTPKTLWKMDESGELIRGAWTAQELFGVPANRAGEKNPGAMFVYARFGDSRFVFEFPHDGAAPRRAFRSDKDDHFVDLSQLELPEPVVRAGRSDGEVEWGSYLTRLLAARLNENMSLLPDPKALKREIITAVIPPMAQSGIWKWAVPEPSDERIGWLNPIENTARALRSTLPSGPDLPGLIPPQFTRLEATSMRKPGSSRT